MAIRHLVLAALLASAFSAHADVIPASPASGLLSHWTVGNDGVNVLGALGSGGAMATNLSMVAGVAYGAGASLDSNGLANALMGSANSMYGKGQNGALSQSKLYFTRGIDGFYLISSAKFTGTTMTGMTGMAGSTVTMGGNSGPSGATGSTTASGSSQQGSNAGAGGSTGLALESGPQQIAAPAAVDVNVVPEPGTGALMLAGLAGVGFMTRRRSR